ncbi:MAG: tRNA pseudouridine(38-40) synthase TruA [Muribaculaceae bacterium]|nr:tRNA pseudouridine(38-40) synthase TruA [Muribaculaceae bacterium]
MDGESLRKNIILDDPQVTTRRFMMVVTFDGAPFHGWQIQPGDRTVQEDIEKALRIALQTPLHIVGAGRTDTGVNARMMTAHFDVSEETAAKFLDDESRRKKVLYTLNGILRPSVVIWDIFAVNNDVHARFDAISRTYRYYLHTCPDPFREKRSRYFFQPLDFDRMNLEASSLLGTKDFTSFSKLHTDTNNNICTVYDADWKQYAAGHFFFEITANRFLRNMVRAIVGTLLDVGTSKQAPGHIQRVLEASNRCAAGSSVPGYALYLWDIKYPYSIPQTLIPDII